MDRGGLKRVALGVGDLFCRTSVGLDQTGWSTALPFDLGFKSRGLSSIICPLGRTRHRWKDNIRINLREIWWESVDWIHLAQGRGQ
jgi:hypothetical protein